MSMGILRKPPTCGERVGTGELGLEPLVICIKAVCVVGVLWESDTIGAQDRKEKKTQTDTVAPMT
jgi:hypothetical protein